MDFLIAQSMPNPLLLFLFFPSSLPFSPSPYNALSAPLHLIFFFPFQPRLNDLVSDRLLYYRGNINPAHLLPALLCPVVMAFQSAVVLIEAANDDDAGRQGREGGGEERRARGGGALMSGVNLPSEREKNTAMLLCVFLC